MAKANEADLKMAMELCNALDALTNKWSPTMPEGAATDCDDEESEYFNIDNNDQCRRALEYLIALADRASLMRVVWGCAVMLDPANALVDPNADTIELHPRLRTCKDSCAGIPDEKLKSWMSPPEGQLGAPHGTWAQQLAAAGQQLVDMQRDRDNLLGIVKDVVRVGRLSPAGHQISLDLVQQIDGGVA